MISEEFKRWGITGDTISMVSGFLTLSYLLRFKHKLVHSYFKKDGGAKVWKSVKRCEGLLYASAEIISIPLSSPHLHPRDNRRRGIVIMDQKITSYTCERCGKKYRISLLRGDREKHRLTCPECQNSSDVEGFLEIVSAGRSRVILSQSHNLHLAAWILFGLTALCCSVTCGIICFRGQSFFSPDIFSAILFISFNGSWYIPVIGVLLMFSALREQGLPSHKLITVASAAIALSLLFIQSRYFIFPENMTLWIGYLIAMVILGICMSGYKGRN